MNGTYSRTLFLTAIVSIAVAVSSCKASTTIHRDNGGELMRYAVMVSKAEEYGTHIRFDGQCSSACTLYLRLPPEKLCATPNTYFQFHQPYGGTERQNQLAKDFLWRNYPQWVKDWLSENGGLSDKLLTMGYDVIRKHVKECS